MSPTHLPWSSAILLSLCTFSEAWAVHHKAGSTVQQGKQIAPIELRRNGAQDGSFNKRQTTELICPEEDEWQDFLQSNPSDRVQSFCNIWLNLAPAIVVQEYTPTVYVL
jgi:hypothetical protein